MISVITTYTLFTNVEYFVIVVAFIVMAFIVIGTGTFKLLLSIWWLDTS